MLAARNGIPRSVNTPCSSPEKPKISVPLHLTPHSRQAMANRYRRGV